jgi:hypothetical protein
VFENGVLKKIYGSNGAEENGEKRALCNYVVGDLYS